MTVRERAEQGRQERHAAYEEMQEMHERAVDERRSFTAQEQARYAELERSFDQANESVERIESQHPNLVPKLTRKVALGAGRMLLGSGGGERGGPTLGREQRMADWQARRANPGGFTAADGEEFSLGRLVRGMVTGRWEDAELERRALAEGTDSAGGFLTPEILASSVIDRVRNQARVIEAGAQTVPLESDRHSIPRLATGVTGAWRNENAAVTEQDPTFERVTFTPRTLAVLTRISFELAEDMTSGSAAIIERELSAALALELDRVALRGTGTAPEPRGVKNQSGVTAQAVGGANGATPCLLGPAHGRGRPSRAQHRAERSDLESPERQDLRRVGGHDRPADRAAAVPRGPRLAADEPDPDHAHDGNVDRHERARRLLNVQAHRSLQVFGFGPIRERRSKTDAQTRQLQGSSLG